MEICRFPVVQKPLERVPLPPRVRSNSTSRTLPGSPGLYDADGCCVEMKDVKKVDFALASPTTHPMPLATKVVPSKIHRNIKMKVDPSTTTTPATILPSPSSPGSYMPLPLPSIVPLPHQANPFVVCPPHLAPSASSPSLPSPSSSSSHSSTSTTSRQQSAPFFVPISMGNGNGSPALMDPHLSHPLSRSASASPVPGSTSDPAKKSPDSKKRPRSASTPSGPSNGEGSGARSKRKRKTPEQLALLEKEFETNPMPNKDVREHLSQHLGLTSRQVQIWFQNKRAKVKNNRVVPGGSQSPQEASSPEGSPSMHSPLTMDSPSSSASSTPLSLSSSSSALSSSYPAPSSPSASFQQFSAIDSFFEPSYFDLLLDAPSYNPTDFLLHQQTV